jgi:hypothetical protein
MVGEPRQLIGPLAIPAFSVVLVVVYGNGFIVSAEAAAEKPVLGTDECLLGLDHLTIPRVEASRIPPEREAKTLSSACLVRCEECGVSTIRGALPIRQQKPPSASSLFEPLGMATGPGGVLGDDVASLLGGLGTPTDLAHRRKLPQ